jgi:hypothetical protein
MSMTAKQLERAAIVAHAAGTPWSVFWSQHGGHVIALEPHDRRRFHRLRQRLLGLLVSGDVDGQEPVGDGWPRPCPWELDAAEGALVLWGPEQTRQTPGNEQIGPRGAANLTANRG